MGLPEGFAEFWLVFWRKVKKDKAIQAWVKIAPDPRLTLTIITAVKAQQKEQLTREPKFRPHAATWLNGREWENETEAPPAGTKPPVKYRPDGTEASPLDVFCQHHLRNVGISPAPKRGCPDCEANEKQEQIAMPAWAR